MSYTMGVDIGSVSSKCVILKDGREIAAAVTIGAGTGTSGPQKAVEAALGVAGLETADILYTVATGYGRVTYEAADEEKSEIACHALGAYFQIPGVRTLIDIGGQDAKAVKIGSDGRVLDFVMNEKCAAGTGRFLEVMAQALGYPVEALQDLAAGAKEPVKISSTCTVFAESEVISHLAAKKRVEDVVAGIHQSIVRRVAGLARRVGLEGPVALTGGVALNAGVVKAFEEHTGTRLTVPAYPQVNGALGAALVACRKLELKV